jgi:hypothetical protein
LVLEVRLLPLEPFAVSHFCLLTVKLASSKRFLVVQSEFLHLCYNQIHP